jgi:uncharacterized repeat protein (TIGR01451 family)
MKLRSVVSGGHGGRLRVRRGAAMVVAVGLAMLGGIAVAASTASATANNPGKVWVCHATDSDTNPYRIIHVDENSTKLQGHLAHRDHPNKIWKLETTFGGVTHPAGSEKPDIIGEPSAAKPPAKCFDTPPSANLKLVKVVENGGVGTAQASEWKLFAKGVTTTLSGYGGFDSTPVPAGDYTLSESHGPANYTPGAAWSCTGTNGLNGHTLTLGDGDNATCTIINTYKQPETNMATLTLVKDVIGGAADAEDWTLKAEGQTTLSAEDQTTFSAEGQTTTFSGEGGASANVAEGSYNLSEAYNQKDDGNANYTASGWVCTRVRSDTEGSHTAITNDSNSTVTIGPYDKAVTCTITNTYKKASLTLRKAVTGANAPDLPSAWTLSAEGNTPVSHASPVTSEVLPGTYKLIELGPTTNYAPQGWVCVPVVNSDASVTLAAGQSTTCTITNAYSPPVTRIVTPDAPGISLKKVATLGDTNHDGVANADESILYTFNVTNTGNVVLTTIAVVDPLLDSAPGSAVTCAPTTLLPGGTATCTAAAFLVTPANATGSPIVNEATASGQTPTGSRVEATDTVRTPTGGAVQQGENASPGNVPAIVPVKVVKGAVVTKATVSPAKVTALAFTGAETVPLGLFGLLALLLGAGLVATTRRQGRRAND